MKAIRQVRLAVMAFLIVTIYVGCTSEPTETQETAVANTYTGKPYRTFVTIQRYNLEQMGAGADKIANVRLDITLPGQQKITLPETGQYWPIGNSQTQEINRTFEIPWTHLRNDGFKITIRMIRRGSEMLPCEFDVSQLSQFNRSYVCHTDVPWQISHNRATEQTADKEGVQIRVFTDLNSPSSEISKVLAQRN